MNLTTAQKYAHDIVGWLEPYCERIEIAGSIRRLRPEPNDVDLVVIPKIDIEKDMFGTLICEHNRLHSFLKTYVETTPGSSWQGGETDKSVNLLLLLPKCQLDIFLATPATFGSVLLCRTGSMQHNIWLCERALAMGLAWRTMKGIVRGSEVLASSTEHEIFSTLKLDYIEPSKRERP